MSIKVSDIFKSTKLADLPQKNSDKPLFMKLKNYKGFNKLPYDSLEYREDLIKIVCDRVNPDLIKYNRKRVFFMHPTYKRYACNVFGGVYDLVLADQPQKMIYHDIIFIQTANDGSGMKYDYIKFKQECLALYPSDKLHLDYQSTLNDEMNTKENEEYELKKSQNEEDSDNDTDDNDTDTDDDE